jgi:uracil DNA glycosylase
LAVEQKWNASSSSSSHQGPTLPESVLNLIGQLLLQHQGEISDLLLQQWWQYAAGVLAIRRSAAVKAGNTHSHDDRSVSGFFCQVCFKD